MRNSPFSRLAIFVVLAITLGAVPQSWGQYAETVPYSFAGGSGDGNQPQGGLIADAAGNLYGTTSVGDGTGCIQNYGCGIVFELTPISGGGWKETILHDFKGGDDGDNPFGNLLLDSQGNLFGVTQQGGGNSNCGYGCGTVYELTQSVSGWKETVLHRFTLGDDGAFPSAGLVADARGNLYGTTFSGGSYGSGIVFKLTPSSLGWQESVLHAFTGTKDGNGPSSVLLFDAVGNLYGTTQYGGYNGINCSSGPGCGIVFKLSPTTVAPWRLSILRTFQGGPDGGFPNGGLIFDSLGNLYGTTQLGYQIASSDCCGTVFELAPTTSGWKETVLHVFNGLDGWAPEGGLVFGPAGGLYGATLFGGKTTCIANRGCGVVFGLTPAADGWKFRSLYRFSGGADGANPEAGLLMDAAGKLYGTTVEGGNTANCPLGCGVVFELSLSANENTK